jgi:hypothetical protein
MTTVNIDLKDLFNAPLSTWVVFRSTDEILIANEIIVPQIPIEVKTDINGEATISIYSGNYQVSILNRIFNVVIAGETVDLADLIQTNNDQTIQFTLTLEDDSPLLLENSDYLII